MIQCDTPQMLSHDLKKVQFGPISTCSEACLMASAARHLLPNPDCATPDTHLRSDLRRYRTAFDWNRWAFALRYTKADRASQVRCLLCRYARR
ncbi:hypothetical protein NPIL_194821 [Nephila pilipes]|uniref:Uncharacterized protein n=1 Tax=Nephila pilipes TaxID=299642 RepID=A0A8X6PJT5_NEPPI|nr:hypothetical protein NPIL_194821 [Nephila pilipes]